jgi:conjugative transfer pilus assembly protein TraH
MKKLAVVALLGSSLSHAGVVDDWLDQSEAHSGAGAYHSGNRGYLSAGSINARISSDREYLMSINPPRLKAGECGVDLFLGGMSYMDIDYLGDKLEAIWQNADAVALSMAMSALSKELEDIGAGFNDAVDFMNSLQFSECQIARQGITALVDATSSMVSEKVITNESDAQETSSDASRNRQEVNEDKLASDGLPKAEVNIESNIKELLAGEGSLIHRLSAAQGIDSQENLLRGYIGDIYLTHAGDGNAPSIKIFPACNQNNDNSINDYIYGTAYQMPRPESIDASPQASCTLEMTSGGLLEHSKTMLAELATNLKDPRETIDPTSDLSLYLNSAPLPVRRIMKSAVDIGIDDDVSSELAHIVAYSTAYDMVNDLYKNTRAAFLRFDAVNAAASLSPTEKATADAEASSEIPAKCNLQPYTHVVQAVKELSKRLDNSRRDIHSQYMAKADELLRLININKHYSTLIDKEKKNLSGSNAP